MNRICDTTIRNLGRRFTGGAVVRPNLAAPSGKFWGRSLPARRET